MNDLVPGNRPSDRPGCGAKPSFSKKPAIPAGFRSPEAALLEESEISPKDWQGLIPAALKLSGIAFHSPSSSTPSPYSEV